MPTSELIDSYSPSINLEQATLALMIYKVSQRTKILPTLTGLLGVEKLAEYVRLNHSRPEEILLITFFMHISMCFGIRKYGFIVLFCAAWRLTRILIAASGEHPDSLKHLLENHFLVRGYTRHTLGMDIGLIAHQIVETYKLTFKSKGERQNIDALITAFKELPNGEIMDIVGDHFRMLNTPEDEDKRKIWEKWMDRMEKMRNPRKRRH
jgi:hypothetical protein